MHIGFERISMGLQRGKRHLVLQPKRKKCYEPRKQDRQRKKPEPAFGSLLQPLLFWQVPDSGYPKTNTLSAEIVAWLTAAGGVL